MDGIFYGYLSDEERAAFIESKKLDNEYNRLNTLYEMVDLELQQMYRDAEVKVLEEGGTFDDLIYLYQEANEEAAQKQSGILDKIFEFIKNIFSSIGQAIANLFNSAKNVDPNTQVEIKEEDGKFLDKLKNNIGLIQGAIKKAVQGDFAGAKADLDNFDKMNAAATFGGVAAVAGVFRVAVKSITEAENPITVIQKDITGAIDKIKAKIDEIKNKKKDDKSTNNNEETEAKGVLDRIKDLGSKILGVLKDAGIAIGKAGQGLADKISGTERKTINNVEYYKKKDGKIYTMQDDGNGNKSEVEVTDQNIINQFNNPTPEGGDNTQGQGAGAPAASPAQGNPTEPVGQTKQTIPENQIQNSLNPNDKNDQSILQKGIRIDNTGKVFRTYDGKNFFVVNFDANGNPDEPRLQNDKNLLAIVNNIRNARMQQAQGQPVQASVDFEQMVGNLYEEKLGVMSDVEFELYQLKLEGYGIWVEDGNLVIAEDYYEEKSKEPDFRNIFGDDINDSEGLINTMEYAQLLEDFANL